MIEKRDVKFNEYLKHQKRSMRCVVCGHGFSCALDPMLDAYPVYHPSGAEKSMCERDFFDTLLRVYQHIHLKGEGLSLSILITQFDWLGLIQHRRDMLLWCLQRGFLTLDNLKRCEVPPPVREACHNLFEHGALEDPSFRREAVEILATALKCLHPELKPVSREELLAQPGFSCQPPSPPANETEPEDPRRMVTVEQTGASEYGLRTSPADRPMDE
ncbi:MAG: hypothetical protein GC154_16665 [bacterium]|nr:hypothetical protein [bacterium]